MLICYWARWADSAGDVSRFSNTCVARVEGWTAPGLAPELLPGNAQQTMLPEGATRSVIQTQPPMLQAKCMIVQLPYAEMLLPEAAPEARVLPGAGAASQHLLDAE